MESLGNIRKWVIKPSLPDLAQSLQPAMQGDAASQQQVCGALLWTAFAAPGAVTEVYDAIAAGAVGDKLESALWNAEECSIPESFWGTFAKTLTGPEQGYDATSITIAVAALGGRMHDINIACKMPERSSTKDQAPRSSILMMPEKSSPPCPSSANFS